MKTIRVSGSIFLCCALAVLAPRVLAVENESVTPASNKRSFEDQFEIARKLLKEGEFTAAILIYQKIVKAHPRSTLTARSKLHIGDCLIGDGKMDAARKHWLAFVKSDPKGPWRGQALISLGDFELEHKLDVEAGSAFFEQARTILERFKFKEVPEGWHEASFIVYYRLAIIEYLKDNKQAARRLIKQSRKLISRKRFGRVKRGAPPNGVDWIYTDYWMGSLPTPGDVLGNNTNAALTLALGDTYFKHGRQYDRASTFYQKVLSKEIENVTSNQRAWASFQLASIASNQNQPADKVIKLYKEVAEKYPKTPTAKKALLYAGLVAWASPKGDRGNAHLKEVIKRYPGSEEAEEAAYQLADNYFSAGQLAEAKAAFEYFLKTFPKSTDVDEIKEELQKVQKLLKKKTR